MLNSLHSMGSHWGVFSRRGCGGICNLKAALVTSEGQGWRQEDHSGNKQGIGSWGGASEEAQQWEAPGQSPEPLRRGDQELGRESDGHSLTPWSLGKTREGTCHPPAPDTTRGAERERNVLGNACVGLWPLEEPGLEVGVKQGQPFIFELLKLVAYINLTKQNQMKT